MLKVNDFFCGAGGIGLGFKYAGFRLAGAWDFDKWAVESYGNNVSPKVKRADITQMTWEEVPYADVWTFGFPCQDISVAGKQAGMVKGKTRSGLFYEVMRLLEETETHSPDRLPTVILAENVKAVKKYLPEIEKEYKARGYRMYATLYNSKYWGVPQNRERYFILGVHASIEKPFIFPEQQTDFIPKLSSVLEDEVDEKYYIDNEKAQKVIEQAKKRVEIKGTHACITPGRVEKRQNGRRAKDDESEMYTLTAQDHHGLIEPAILRPERTDYGKSIRKQYENGEIKEKIGNMREWRPRPDDISNTLTTVQKDNLLLEPQPKIDVVGMLDIKGKDNIRRVYDTEGLSPTLTTSEGGHRQPKVLVNEKVDTEPHLKVVGNTSATGFDKSNVYDVEGISPTVEARDYKGPNQILEKKTVIDDVKRAVKKTRPNEEIGIKVFDNGNIRPHRMDKRKSGISEMQVTYEENTAPTCISSHVSKTYGDSTGWRVRKLTPREYARLQGFPDSYKQVVSNTQFYKQIGNAVTVTVAQAIAEAIKDYLERD